MCSHTISVIALLVTKSKFKDFPVLYFNIGDLLVIMAKCFFLEEPIFTEKPHFSLIRYDNYWAPAKRSQHLNATYPNIVGPAFASSGQTIATFERNTSQHCWAQNVARVWPPCCIVSRHVASWKLNLCARLRFSIFNSQRVATLCNRVGKRP